MFVELTENTSLVAIGITKFAYTHKFRNKFY